MQFVQQYGAVWRLSEKAYAKLLKQIEKNESYDLDKLGKQIAQDIKDVLKLAK